MSWNLRNSYLYVLCYITITEFIEASAFSVLCMLFKCLTFLFILKRTYWYDFEGLENAAVKTFTNV